MNTDIDVLDMVQELANSSNTDASDLFKKQEPVEKPVEDKQIKPEKKKWTPNQSLLEDLPELNSAPVTYAADDITYEEKKEPLKNLMDDEAITEAQGSMNEMERKFGNIEAAKKRHGIDKLQIPEGEYQLRIYTAAIDTDTNVAQAKLDEIFNEIKEIHPDFILSYIEKPVETNAENKQEDIKEDVLNDEIAEENIQTEDTDQVETKEVTNSDNVKVIIDKSNVSDFAWDPEDINKIKKSRSIELNIVETSNLEYSNIEDVDDNWIDAALIPYQRKMNDVTGALPASKYRATFTGLSYSEVIDFENIYDYKINNFDTELKKWTVAYKHMYNQSIGGWEEYYLYKDPETKRTQKVATLYSIPKDVPKENIHMVSKFEDFLRKTSFLDIEYILWRIVCASSMSQEVIPIECHADLGNGRKCNKSYDWIYSPAELIDMKSIDPQVLEDMKVTSEVSGDEAIAENYMSSMLNTNNTIKLPSSGISVVFGHISAYEYLYNVYDKVKNMIVDAKEGDIEIESKTRISAMLTVIKAFLIPKENGGYLRVKGVDNIIRVINNLNEIDWQALEQIIPLMIRPYEIKYSLRDLVCPECHNKSEIVISDMMQLLFILARSLSSVNVTLKKN